MKKRKFNVGDIVQVISKDFSSRYYGKYASVRIRRNDGYVTIKYLKHIKGCVGLYDVWCEKDVVLVNKDVKDLSCI